MIHRQALASDTLSFELTEVLTDVMQMVNNIQSSAFNTRLLKLLCKDFTLLMKQPS